MWPVDRMSGLGLFRAASSCATSAVEDAISLMCAGVNGADDVEHWGEEDDDGWSHSDSAANAVDGLFGTLTAEAASASPVESPFADISLPFAVDVPPRYTERYEERGCTAFRVRRNTSCLLLTIQEKWRTYDSRFVMFRSFFFCKS